MLRASTSAKFYSNKIGDVITLKDSHGKCHEAEIVFTGKYYTYEINCKTTVILLCTTYIHWHFG